MAEVIISGPEGRIEGRYKQSPEENAPIALVLHPHPLYGGTMNNKVVYNMYHCFVKNGFSTLRINFRGVGKSQGEFDNGIGELTDAATVLDWMHLHNPMPKTVWIAGFSFGAWITMQILMRRPEIANFIAISPPVDKYDFSFLSPCPIPGLIAQGNQDSIVDEAKVTGFVNKIPKQRSAKINYHIIENADHFYRNKLDILNNIIDQYIFDALNPLESKPTTSVKEGKQLLHEEA